MPRVAVSIVTWNSMQYLPDAIASVASQTYPDLSLIVVDNASIDGSADYVREHAPDAMVLRNSKNLGFSRAHDQAIAYAAAHLRKDDDLFMLVMNPDVVLEPEFVATLVEQVARRPEVGSAGGKMLRMRRTGEESLESGEKSDIIDSAGLAIARSRRAYDRGSGERDDGKYSRTEEVFGISGALALYRFSALESVAFPGVAGGAEYFDEDFFAYKEDVDLAWRLRLAGWQALYVPTAVAYHYRGAAEGGKSNIRTLLNRFRKSKTVNYLSYRNHALMLKKNDRFLDALLALPWILWYEFRKFVVVLFLEPRSLRAIPSALGLLPRMMRKRAATMRSAKVKGKDMRRWFA